MRKLSHFYKAHSIHELAFLLINIGGTGLTLRLADIFALEV